MNFLQACTQVDIGRRVGLRDDNGELIQLRLRGIHKIASLAGFCSGVYDGVGLDEITRTDFEYMPDSEL